MKALNPWLDAAEIAFRLQPPDAELTVVIGARAWCEKCRRLYPAFEALQSAAPERHRVWLWLDLEEHAEFIGSFIPDDLPLLLRYRGGQPVEAGILDAIDAQGWRLRAGGAPVVGGPSFWQTFTAENWASASNGSDAAEGD